MFMKYEMQEKELEIFFEEDIDHHSCLKFAVMIDDAIKKYMPCRILFDFEKVTFMDSSGIGMLIGRYRKMIRNNGYAEVINVKPELHRIFEMSGIFKIMPERATEHDAVLQSTYHEDIL